MLLSCVDLNVFQSERSSTRTICFERNKALFWYVPLSLPAATKVTASSRIKDKCSM